MEWKCLDCKKIISNRSIRCKRCANKFRIGTHYGKESKLGKKNPAWKGGISDGYYKRIVYENYPYECQICGSNFKLCCHHKDGNRKNNNLLNLMLVCHSCHEYLHQRRRNRGMV